ncbi:MAG: class I SAM-dependent methyltransferase [Chitinophagaceae bacterium]
MIISDTSALVLNWTSKNVWQSKNAKDYFNNLDLSAADVLYKRFDKHLDFVQRQILTNRKFFVRKCVVEFLEQCKIKNVIGQVVILAAGIDPLSVEIASLYLNSKVFDIDKYSLKEKEKCLNGTCPNIKFIQCDITNIELLKKCLAENGYNFSEPGIMVLEGITYYLTENELRNVLTFFAASNSKMVCDFGINPECVDEDKRALGIEIVSKIVETVGLEFMNCYEPAYFMKLVEQCGFKNAQRFKVENIQQQRTGEINPFEGNESAWVALVKS